MLDGLQQLAFYLGWALIILLALLFTLGGIDCSRVKGGCIVLWWAWGIVVILPLVAPEFYNRAVAQGYRLHRVKNVAFGWAAPAWVTRLKRR